MNKIINYNCRFKGRKRVKKKFPFSSELFLRLGEVGRIVEIFPPTFISKGGWEGCLWGKRVESFFPFSKGFFCVAWGNGRFGFFSGEARPKPLKIC
jgi:hypothetical protein